MNRQLISIKRLLSALAISGTANIVLLSLLFYWLVNETPPLPHFERQTQALPPQKIPVALDQSNSEVIRKYRNLSSYELLPYLRSKRLIENGYTERDLSIACLAYFHHFDLQRALSNLPSPLQSRTIVYGKNQNGTLAMITVYPQLTDEHFAAILKFAHTEKWPFSSKGLFTLLQKKEDKDSTLADAFFLTKEFTAVQTLIARSEVAIDKLKVLNMLLQGTWEMLADFAQQQSLCQDLTKECRQKLLVDYIEKGAVDAADILLLTDNHYAIRKLDNNHILKMLELLTEKTDANEKFALALLQSPRSDAVWKMAAERLYNYAGENKPQNVQPESALARFMPQQAPASVLKGMEKPQIMPKETNHAHACTASKAMPTVKRPTSSPQKDSLYIVQEGDNLWKLSRRFHIDVNALRKHNRLKSDALKPGTPLRIPCS